MELNKATIEKLQEMILDFFFNLVISLHFIYSTSKVLQQGFIYFLLC